MSENRKIQVPVELDSLVVDFIRRFVNRKFHLKKLAGGQWVKDFDLSYDLVSNGLFSNRKEWPQEHEVNRAMDNIIAMMEEEEFVEARYYKAGFLDWRVAYRTKEDEE